MKRNAKWLLSAAMFITTACDHLVPCDGGRLVPNAEHVWVEIMPTQCLSNVWQQEWIEENGEYSREQEEEALHAFFRKRGVDFYEYRTEQVADIVCAACGCLEGYAARLRIDAKNLSTFEQYGFTLGSGSAALCDDLPDSVIAFNAEPQRVNFGGSYTLHADSAALEGTTLKLVLSYSGGCREHEYELRLNRIENTVAYIFLHHNANGDPCEAYLTVRLRADLQSFFMRDDWAKLVLLGPNGEQISLR